MKAKNLLYFIPILAKAFERPDSETAFKEAIEEIQRLGKLPEYEVGYEQFKSFMKAGIEGIEDEPGKLSAIKETVLERIITALATDTFIGSEEVKSELLKRIHDDPEIEQQYEKTVSELYPPQEKYHPLALELFKNDSLIVTHSLPEATKEIVYNNIDEGNYILKLSNGRVLWEGNIDRNHIMWEHAFPGKALPMVADTGETEVEPTMVTSLLDGEITIKLFAGLETGRIVITLNE